MFLGIGVPHSAGGGADAQEEGELDGLKLHTIVLGNFGLEDPLHGVHHIVGERAVLGESMPG